jgi:HEAT repeat protein
MNTMLRRFTTVVLVALVLGCAPAAARAQPDKVKADFEKAMAAEAMDAQLAGVDAVVASGLPEGVMILLPALERSLIVVENMDRVLKARKERKEHLERKQKKNEEPAPKLKKVLDEMAKFTARKADAAKLRDAIQAGLGKLFAGLAAEARDAAAEPLIEAARREKDVGRRARMLTALGSLNGPGPREAILPYVADKVQEVRIAAARALLLQAGGTGDGTSKLTAPFWSRAFTSLTESLGKAIKNREKLHKKYEAAGKKFHKLTVKERTAGLPKKAIKPSAERDRLGYELMADQEFIDTLRLALGRIFARLPADVQTPLVAPLLKRVGRGKPADRVELAETLGHLKCDAARDALMPLVDDKAPELRIVAVEALGRMADPRATPALARAIKDPFWQVRSVAIDALARIGGRPAVDALVIAMAGAEGRIVHDLSDALVKLTGQDFHENKVLWRDWWKKNRDAYTGPPAVAKAGGKKPAGEGGKPDDAQGEADKGGEKGVSFYGIRTRSKRIIYILDVSGSMNWELGAYAEPGQRPRMGPVGERKIDQAIDELKTSITSLPKDATFNIVFYASDVDVWQKKLVVASPDNKKKAIHWAEAINADGATNIFNAIERAFQFAGRGTFDSKYAVAADTFYLLSDGRSNRGRVIDADAILLEVKRLNRFQKVVVHSIALGRDADFDFMEKLAKQNGGKFIEHSGR